jgi:hypothetical protein
MPPGELRDLPMVLLKYAWRDMAPLPQAPSIIDELTCWNEFTCWRRGVPLASWIGVRMVVAYVGGLHLFSPNVNLAFRLHLNSKSVWALPFSTDVNVEDRNHRQREYNFAC